MKQLVALLVLVAVVTACGASDPAASPPATTTDAGDVQVRPTSPPPTLDIDGPPPAWIETEDGSLWLAYATYCWATACADYVPPRCGDEKLAPAIEVRRSEVVRFHLEFRPEGRVTLQFFAEGKEPRAFRLGRSQTPTWKVRRGGVFWVGANGGSGSANYAGCFKVVA